MYQKYVYIYKYIFDLEYVFIFCWAGLYVFLSWINWFPKKYLQWYVWFFLPVQFHHCNCVVNPAHMIYDQGLVRIPHKMHLWYRLLPDILWDSFVVTQIPCDYTSFCREHYTGRHIFPPKILKLIFGNMVWACFYAFPCTKMF